jgi:hypothetical protein
MCLSEVECHLQCSIQVSEFCRRQGRNIVGQI